jgi:hypothetical protein
VMDGGLRGGGEGYGEEDTGKRQFSYRHLSHVGTPEEEMRLQ